VAVRQNTELFGLRDVKIRRLVSDSPNVSAPTYGPAIDVPGAASLEITPEIETQELRGDDALLAQQSAVVGYNVTLTFVRTDLQVWAAVFGSTVDTPDDDTAIVRFRAGDELPYFRLDGLVEGTAEGVESVRYTIYKMKVTDASIVDTDQQEFATLRIEGRAVALEAAGDNYNGVYIAQTHSTEHQDLSS
jgi:hypothetical protein